MIKFMIIAAPRSGTAWCANWLTDHARHCVHDPMYDYHYDEFDSIAIGSKDVGIACTGIALFPEWVLEHPARKVILHRDKKEVNAALGKQGVPRCPPALFKGLERINGLHVRWNEIFLNPEEIWRYLFDDEPFDSDRHKLLCSMNVQSNWRAKVQNPEVINRLRAEQCST